MYNNVNNSKMAIISELHPSYTAVVDIILLLLSYLSPNMGPALQLRYFTGW